MELPPLPDLPPLPGSKPLGRPPGYRDSFADEARRHCQMGATDIELADFFEISVVTLYRWKHKYPEFAAAIVTGKDSADERVERAFYNRCVGYTYDSEKVFCNKDGIVRTDTLEHVPPDPGAALNWLKNRRPKEWREKITQEHTVADGVAELMRQIDGRTRGLPNPAKAAV
jgi:hypothetical protein